jgi:hypothetical protein
MVVEDQVVLEILVVGVILLRSPLVAVAVDLVVQMVALVEMVVQVQ